MSVLLEWDRLHITYHKAPVMEPFSGAIRRGEKWALRGPNGAGKSSWMKTVLGLLPAGKDSQIKWHLNNKDISYAPQSLDFDSQFPVQLDEFLEISCANPLLQSPFPWISNIHKIQAAAKRFDVEDLLFKKLEELSRGQVQRAILARAYLNQPQLVFFDEPLTGLDPKSRSRVLSTIFNQTETIVMITHESDWQSMGFTHALHFSETMTSEGCYDKPVIQSLS